MLRAALRVFAGFAFVGVRFAFAGLCVCWGAGCVFALLLLLLLLFAFAFGAVGGLWLRLCWGLLVQFLTFSILLAFGEFVRVRLGLLVRFALLAVGVRFAARFAFLFSGASVLVRRLLVAGLLLLAGFAFALLGLLFWLLFGLGFLWFWFWADFFF